MDAPPTLPAPAGVPVEIRGVRRQFDPARPVIEGFSLDIPAGQFLALLGPSGCGKSTLLRLLAGLDRPDGGSIRIHSPGNDPNRAYVFQDAHLLPWATALDNAALPLKIAGMRRRARRAQAEALLRRVGLGDALRRYPAQLSGGMRMRVSLARALITDPALLLLDEPFAALDEITRQQLDDLLLDLWQTRRPTVVFVTHAIHEAVYLAQRVVLLAGPPARITADQPIDLPAHRSADLRTTDAFIRPTRRLFERLRDASAD